MSRYDGENPSRRNPIPRRTPAERTLAGWTFASSRCRPIPRGSGVNATSTTSRSPSANSPRPAYGSKASYPRVALSARPRTTLVTLTFPTRSWSPSCCRAWISSVRWYPEAARSSDGSPYGSTGFHSRSRREDCRDARM